MKVIFMIDNMKGFGGAQRVIANLCNELAQQGNSVMLLLTGNATETVYKLENSIVIKAFDDISPIKKLHKLRKTVVEYKPNVVVSFLTMVNIVAAITTMGTKIPLIISERNDPDYCTKREKKLSRLFYQFAEVAVVQTEDIRTKLRRIYHGKTEIIENPLIDHAVDKIDYAPTHKIVAVGRLTKQKNYKLMLLAFSDFLKNYSDYSLDIYGVGELETELKEYANQLKIDKSVNFKGNSNAVIELEKAYDFYIMSSDHEGMSNALAEAMSIGLPCIATDCDGGGAAALIRNNINGILVPKNDVTALTKAMVALGKNPKYSEFLGTNAKNIRIKLDSREISRRWIDLINSTGIEKGDRNADRTKE